MLNAYLNQTQRLLQNPAASTVLYSQADLTSYINTARGQVAGEAACIRQLGTLTLTQGISTYAFTSVVIPSMAALGIAGILNIREMTINVVGGVKYLQGWAWEWFNRYYVAVLNASQSTPQNWAQYAQGVLGSAALRPIPDQTYTVNVDAVCYPADLVNDSSLEPIPYPWTDAVPFYAAYYAMMSSQRQQDADKMFQRYEEFTARARRLSTPAVLPNQYEQSAQVPISPAGGGR